MKGEKSERKRESRSTTRDIHYALSCTHTLFKTLDIIWAKQGVYKYRLCREKFAGDRRIFFTSSQASTALVKTCIKIGWNFNDMGTINC